MRGSGTLISASLLGLAATALSQSNSVSTTPHAQFSSSVGVLGCKINTNRVAYWPGAVDCTNICVKLTYGERSVFLLRIDQSGGAHDISYDAWNYLQTGQSATVDPITGGSVAMEYEEVDASQCADLIYTNGSKLPLSASNSMNFLTSCLDQPNSWVAQNYVLYNICDPICTLGFDETCTLDLTVSNQASCPHTLGLTSPLTTVPVYDVQYQSGDLVSAGTGQPAPAGTKIQESIGEPGSAGQSADSSSPQPTPSPAAFIEVSSSLPGSQPTQSTTIVAPSSSTTSTTTSDSAATSELPNGPASNATALTTASPATSTAALSASYANRTATYITTSASSNAGTQTTMSVVTVLTGAGTPTGSPTVVPSTGPASAGYRTAHVPVLILGSTILITSILSIF